MCRRFSPPPTLHDPVAVMVREVNTAFYAWAVVMGEHQRRYFKATDMEFHDEEWLGAIKGIFGVIEGIVEDGLYPRGLVYEYLNHTWRYFLEREVINANNPMAPENAPEVMKWVSERGYWVMRTTRMEAAAGIAMDRYIKDRRRQIGTPAPNMIREVHDEG